MGLRFKARKIPEVSEVVLFPLSLVLIKESKIVFLWGKLIFLIKKFLIFFRLIKSSPIFLFNIECDFLILKWEVLSFNLLDLFIFSIKIEKTYIEVKGIGAFAESCSYPCKFSIIFETNGEATARVCTFIDHCVNLFWDRGLGEELFALFKL